MVFCPLPSQLSEEEKFLQQKYLKLKLKKVRFNRIDDLDTLILVKLISKPCLIYF